MPPDTPPPSRTLRIVGARRGPGPFDVRSVVGTLRRFAAEGDGLVALFDARGVAGERHVLSAWAHMGRARAQGGERLHDRGAELALYLAGDDQLPRALAKVGVAADTEQFVLVAERPREPADLLAAFGLAPDDSAYPRAATEELLDRLGVSRAERESVAPSAWEGLVLERVALLDLSAPHAGHPAPQKA